MDDAEVQVQKNIGAFCKYLPLHVEIWQSVMEKSVKPLQSLNNLCQQQRHVSRVKLDFMENFQDAQISLQFEISNRIEEELLHLKELIDNLCKSSNDLKNRLLNLERSTLSLDWEEESAVIRGSGSQPSLIRLLQDGLMFSNFFSSNAKIISNNFKLLKLTDEKSLKALQDAFQINLNHKTVMSLVALTQYVENDKAII